MPRPSFKLLALFVLLLGACGEERVPAPSFPSSMAATANPHATRAAAEILKEGGGALDAAIAAQMTLNLVEPQSSGIGGGGFLLYWEAAEKTLWNYDGRETAPLAAGADLFLFPDGEPLSFLDAMVGGISTGAPGLPAMLEKAHQRHGRLPWERLFAPAIHLAEKGFPLSPRLHAMLARDPVLPTRRDARALYYEEEKEGGALRPLPVGSLIKNPRFAETLRLLAKEGARIFYEGRVGEEIVRAVQNAPHRPGRLSLEDLANYRAKIRPKLCGGYRRFTICAMPPPSSGGVTLLQILSLIEPFDIPALSPQSLEAVHLISEASRLAYADRARYLADPDFVSLPVKALLNHDYLRRRGSAISQERAIPRPEAGALPQQKSLYQSAHDESLPSTTHMSVLDRWGNAASLTSSIEAPFGSHLMAGGFFLNNQLTDFSFAPRRAGGAKIANAVEGGKRPLSSMTPTIIFNEEGDPIAILGSPGGKRIIAYVAQTVVALLDWNMTMQEAIDLPRHVALGKELLLEAGTDLEALRAPLERLGHKVQIRPITSGLHGILIRDGRLWGGADPRREGVAQEVAN